KALGSDGGQVFAPDRAPHRAGDRALESARRAPAARDEVVRRGEVAHVMWSIRILAARLRPFNAAAVLKVSITGTIVALFLLGDFALFRRVFRAIAKV